MKPERPKPQVLPAELVNGILNWVKNRFYADDPNRFYQDRRFLMRLATWPARWFWDKRIDPPQPVFEKLILDILRDTTEHCRQDQIKYVPGYLLFCIQEHFSHHGDEIYDQHKSARNNLGRLLDGLRPADPKAIQDRTVEVLSQVNQVLAPKGRAPRKKVPKDAQLTLL